MRIDEGIAVISLVVTVGSVVWGVITRYLFPQPAAWTYEVATMAFAWMVFFGAASGVRRGLHADIDIFVHYLPERWQTAIDIGNWILLAAFFAVMGGLFALLASNTVHVYTIALSLPQAVTYAPLSAACLMMLVHHLGRWGRWRAAEPADAENII